MSEELLFVYGTLKRSVKDSKSYLLAPYCNFYCDASVNGKLYLAQHETDTQFAYPALVYNSNTDAIVCGGLYTIYQKEALFEVLDDYEGCSEEYSEPYQYQRRQIDAYLSNGQKKTVWTYVYNWSVNELDLIQSGDFS